MQEKQYSILTDIFSMQLNTLDHKRNYAKTHYYIKLVLYMQDIHYPL